MHTTIPKFGFIQFVHPSGLYFLRVERNEAIWTPNPLHSDFSGTTVKQMLFQVEKIYDAFVCARTMAYFVMDEFDQKMSEC
jgi:hypothetical protein